MKKSNQEKNSIWSNQGIRRLLYLELKFLSFPRHMKFLEKVIKITMTHSNGLHRKNMMKQIENILLYKSSINA